jgi:hypothetical protein
VFSRDGKMWAGELKGGSPKELRISQMPDGDGSRLLVEGGNGSGSCRGPLGRPGGWTMSVPPASRRLGFRTAAISYGPAASGARQGWLLWM